MVVVVVVAAEAADEQFWSCSLCWKRWKLWKTQTGCSEETSWEKAENSAIGSWYCQSAAARRPGYLEADPAGSSWVV